MNKCQLAAFVLLSLIFTFTANAQTQQPTKPAEQKPALTAPEVAAKMDKQRALQWYVIETVAFCFSEAGRISREEGRDALNIREGRYRYRLEATTFEELTGLSPIITADLDPRSKETLKLTFANAMVEMWRKGACKQSTGSSSNQ